MSRIRWSDNDHFFGPITYSRDSINYRPLTFVLGSGDNDENPTCRLHFSAFGHTLIIALPAVLKPWRVWVDTSGRDWSGPNGGFWDTGEREYGFTLYEGHLDVKLGRVTNDSGTEQRWSCFLPWTQWRFIRRSLYDAYGAHFWTEPKGAGFAACREAKDLCPSVKFTFTDFDGEKLIASTMIEEHEWKFGTGWFKWLSIFRRPKIRRSLNIEYSGEVGNRKGSWKGGTIGTGIDLLPGELHEPAFVRHCAKDGLTFGARLDETEPVP